MNTWLKIIRKNGVLFGVMLAVLFMLSGCGAEVPAASPVQAEASFVFTDQGITASGEEDCYEISGTALTISASGAYTLTGTCADGSIQVAAGTENVTLILDGLDLTATSTAPIVCGKSSQVTIQVTGDSTLEDGEDAADDGLSDSFEGACIKVKSGATLSLTGDAQLTVNGSCKNGIKGGSEADITVSGLTLTIAAANNALASDGSVTVESGILELTSDGDGIKAEPDETDTVSAGTVTVTGGTITITAAGDGVQASGDVIVNGGIWTVTTGGGADAELDESASAKGIKSAGNVTITGGTFLMDCADDALHADGDLTMEAGCFTIASGDDAAHADYALILGVQGSETGPEIEITTCCEGLEGATVTLYSGTGTIVSTDDGINAANADLGNGYDFTVDVYGGTWYIDAGCDGIDSNRDVNLYGGTIEVFGAATSVDSALDYDGTCTYQGGTLLAVGMSNMAQAPSSGTYVTFGAAGMGGGMGGMHMGGGARTMETEDGQAFDPAAAGSDQDFPQRGEMPTENGTRPENFEGQEGQMTRSDDGTLPQEGELTLPADRTEGIPGGAVPGDGGATTDSTISISAGSSIEIKDSEGNVLYAVTGIKTANSVVFASDDLVTGETYLLYVDGTEVATAVCS